MSARAAPGSRGRARRLSCAGHARVARACVRRGRAVACAAVVVAAAPPCAQGAPLECSGPGAAGRVALAELFSTDACESCPPAEEIFNRLRGSAWKDRLAAWLRGASARVPGATWASCPG